MKKLLSLILAAATVLSLCGCKKEVPETTALVTEAATAPTETTAATTAPTETTVETTEAATEPEEKEGATGEVTSNTLNIRTGAGSWYSSVGTLEKGAEVRVYERTQVNEEWWGRIDQGWVSLRHIKLAPGALNKIPKSNAPEHVHEYAAEVTEPDCEERGYTRYTCECGDSYVDNYTNALGHIWTDWKTVVEPTQLATGLAQRACGRCHTFEERTLDKLIQDHTHSYQSTVTDPPTCATQGIRTYLCSCGSKYTEAIPKLDHTFTASTVSPTCRSEGYVEHVCTKCGQSYRDTYTQRIAHDYTAKGVPAACEEAGCTEHTCRMCGHRYTDRIVPALGHNWGEWVITQEPSVSSTGMKERNCQRCGKTETGTVPRLEETQPTQPTEHVHSYEITKTVPATCTKEGLNTFTCVCGDEYTKPIPMVPHNWVHRHRDETGHTELRYACYCGWTCSDSENHEALFLEHLKSLGTDTDGHACYSTSAWVVDTPAKDWDECSVCGTGK